MEPESEYVIAMRLRLQEANRLLSETLDYVQRAYEGAFSDGEQNARLENDIKTFLKIR